MSRPLRHENNVIKTASPMLCWLFTHSLEMRLSYSQCSPAFLGRNAQMVLALITVFSQGNAESEVRARFR